MTVLGFLVIALILSLAKMYFFSSTAEWRANKQSHVFSKDQEMKELDQGTLSRQHEWAQSRK